MPAIAVRDLKKSYGAHVALRGINFSIEHGEVVGFLGPNGAGKSTAMKILTGYLTPSAGDASVEGYDVLTEPIQARAAIGYLPESAPLYTDMRVEDYLEFVGQVRGLGDAERTSAIARVASLCGIADRLAQTIGTLSKGYRQRVGLAQALLHDPSILILDEPTTGLDPNQIVEIRNLIREIGRKKTVLLSTHILSEVVATCDRVIIIHRGEIAADGPTRDVTVRDQGGRLLRVTYTAGKVTLTRDDLERRIRALPGVERCAALEEEDRAHHSFELLVASDLRPALFQLAVDEGLILLELHEEKSNLEEVFRRLTRS